MSVPSRCQARATPAGAIGSSAGNTGSSPRESRRVKSMLTVAISASLIAQGGSPANIPVLPARWRRGRRHERSSPWPFGWAGRLDRLGGPVRRDARRNLQRLRGSDRSGGAQLEGRSPGCPADRGRDHRCPGREPWRSARVPARVFAGSRLASRDGPRRDTDRVRVVSLSVRQPAPPASSLGAPAEAAGQRPVAGVPGCGRLYARGQAGPA